MEEKIQNNELIIQLSWKPVIIFFIILKISLFYSFTEYIS